MIKPVILSHHAFNLFKKFLSNSLAYSISYKHPFDNLLQKKDYFLNYCNNYEKKYFNHSRIEYENAEMLVGYRQK